MKIRITEKGWGGYTGHFGTVEFADGVSIDEVSKADAAALAGLISIEEVGTGANPSVAQRIIDTNDNSAPVEPPKVETTENAPVPTHTLASLEAIADKSGIKGLREIADPLGLKGNSIAELIQKVLTDQAEKLEKAKTAGAAQA